MCVICGKPFNVPCNCNFQSYCDPCAETTCKEERAECVFYRLDDDSVNRLSCLAIPNNVSVEFILEELDERVCRILGLQRFLIEIDTDSVDLATSGIVSHTLSANVRIDPASTNNLETLSNGLYSAEYDGKIKVTIADTKDYLEEQVEGGADIAINVAVYEDTGLLKMQPSIDISALLNEIRVNHLTRFCELVAACP